ncbi:MAG: hypothetical protein JNM94_01345 [Phycisphaerae bacterium]|nr:hypothetical protein [Phycisphaerae bacterium]
MDRRSTAGTRQDRGTRTGAATTVWRAMRCSMRELVVSLVVILVLVEIASVVFALQASRTDPRSLGGGVRIAGAAAASRGWPVTPPSPGPAPDILDVTTTFSARVIDAQALRAGVATHAIEVREFGWPFPVLRDIRFLWPSDNASTAAVAPIETGLRLVPSALLLNPLVVGGLLWLAMLVPLALVLGLRRWIRAMGGRCAACGHQTRGGAVCPECGAAAPSGSMKPHGAR